MSSTEEHLYNVDLKWSEGRIGKLTAPELEESIHVATPPEFPGGVEGIWSPEHLFVASVSSCLMTSFLAVAEYSKFDYADLKIQASGTMGKEDGKFRMTRVTLRPELFVHAEADSAKGLKLLEKAEHICLISRSINSEIAFEPKITVVS
jgi:peroxiredoxin-like protein